MIRATVIDVPAPIAALVALTATCAKVCFSLMVEAEKQRLEGHVGHLQRENR